MTSVEPLHLPLPEELIPRKSFRPAGTVLSAQYLSSAPKFPKPGTTSRAQRLGKRLIPPELAVRLDAAQAGRIDEHAAITAREHKKVAGGCRVPAAIVVLASIGALMILRLMVRVRTAHPPAAPTGSVL